MTISHKKLFFSATILAATLFFSSCGENTDKQKTETDKPNFSAAAYLAKDTIGVFRGAEFGDEMEVIRLMEADSALMFGSPNVLRYEYKLPGERCYFMDYTFKRNKLTSFTFDIFLIDETEADKLTTEFNGWFTKKFGEATSEMGFYVWPIKTTVYNEAYLELKDESAEYGYGKVNITAYAI